MIVALVGQEDGEEAQQHAASFMKVIAEQYCKDILMPDDLYKRRDEMLRDKFGTDFKGKISRKVGILKRPCAGEPTAEPSKAKAQTAKTPSAAAKAPATTSPILPKATPPPAPNAKSTSTGSAPAQAPQEATQASATPPKASSAASPDLRVYLAGPPDFAKWL